MALRKGRNINQSDSAILDSTALNNSTSVKIRDAGNGFIYWSITNDSKKDVWLKLQAAATDDDKKGIFLVAGSYWEMPSDNLYTGEVSAIMDSGNETVYTTEY